LEDAIRWLQQEEPSFQAVIRSANGGDENPIVKLHLKNVSVDQVMQVLSKKYGWGIEEVGNPPIYVIAVRGEKSPEWSVSAYCLTPIIDQLMDRKGHNPNNEDQAAGGAAIIDPRAVQATSGTAIVEPNSVKAAAQKADEIRNRSALLADVVATVDTAVKMSSDGEAVMIQVHEPTEMLIMRTGPKQREAAERVLKALDPGNTVVKAEGFGVPHRADPFFSGGPGSSDTGNVDPLIAREIEKMQLLEAQQILGTGDKAEVDTVRRLYEKRIRELQQELAKQANPAPATQPHEALPALPKN